MLCDMSVTLATDDFTLLLAAAKLTAYARPDEDQILAGLYLYTAAGETGEGQGTLLVGVGFDGATVGQFAVPCSGTLATPILLDAPDKDYLVQMCKRARTAAKKVDKEATHEVEITASGESLEIKTMTNGFPETHDRSSDLSLLDATEYPSAEANTRLSVAGIDAVPVDGDVLVRILGKQSLTIMKNAATTLKSTIRVFPSKVNGGPAILTNGDNWRAVTSVEPYEGDTAGAPDVDPITVPSATSSGTSASAPSGEPTPTDDADY